LESFLPETFWETFLETFWEALAETFFEAFLPIGDRERME
jgi:hypothetical protein